MPPRHIEDVEGNWTVPGLARTEFTTTDPDVAREIMSAAYVDVKTRVSGSMENLLLEHVRHDLGPVRLDSVHHTLTTDYVAGPLGCVQIVRILDNPMMYETDGEERHYGPGEVFLAAQPDKPFTARNDRARCELTGLDLSFLAEVTDEPPLDAVRRFQATALPADRADY